MKLKYALLLFLSVLLLTACGGKSAPEPTISAEQIQKWAAETVDAIVAQDKPATTQIAVLPQATPTSQIIAVPPTIPALPTAIPTLPVATQSC